MGFWAKRKKRKKKKKKKEKKSEQKERLFRKYAEKPNIGPMSVCNRTRGFSAF